MSSYSNSRAGKMLEEIKAKREIMIDCASKNGFTNEMTIRLSQELDGLINEYQRTFRYSCEPSKEVRRTVQKMVLVFPANTYVEI